jgi:hypothetical protein
LVNFTHIAALCLVGKQVNFVKLHIFDTKHKISTYNDYLTRCDKCVPVGVDHQALSGDKPSCIRKIHDFNLSPRIVTSRRQGLSHRTDPGNEVG